MTLRELKDMIDDLVTDHGEGILEHDVMAVYDYGDYHHTQALQRLRDVDVVIPKESAYSASRLALPSEEEMDEINEIKEEIECCAQRIASRSQQAEQPGKTSEEISALCKEIGDLELAVEGYEKELENLTRNGGEQVVVLL